MPHRVRLPALEGCNAHPMPQPASATTRRKFHSTSSQKLAVDMGPHLQFIMSLKQRWGHQGCLCGQKETKQIYYLHTRPSCIKGTICLVEPTHACSGWRLTSLALAAVPPQVPQTFLEVLQSWGNTWLWDNILIVGGLNWLHKAI